MPIFPKNENEFIDRVHEAGCGDLFPYLSEKDYKLIAEDGKIPNHQRWAQRIANGELAIDTLLNLADWQVLLPIRLLLTIVSEE